MPATPMTLSPDHVPTTVVSTPREQALADVFTTALEGGIGYWSVCTRYKWYVGPDADLDKQAADFIAVIEVTEDDDAPTYVIDAGVIARGIRRAYDYYKGSDGQPYIARALRDLNFGKWDEVDYDSTVADVIVQFGLLGELVYG